MPDNKLASPAAGRAEGPPPHAAQRDDGPPVAYTIAQKGRRGPLRWWHATAHSWAGLREGWKEPAFRLEVLVGVVALGLAFAVGRSWVETAVLAGSVMLVWTVELLNTAIEAAIDRFGPEWHPLSRRAKDLGSAAVLVSLLWCLGVWGAAGLARLDLI